MKYFKCTLEEVVWCEVYIKDQHFIFANDAQEARNKIARHWEIRRNAKGLKVEEIELFEAEIYSKTITELVTEEVWNSFMQHSYPEQSYKKVKHYYCSHCNGEVYTGDRICIHCGAQFNT